MTDQDNPEQFKSEQVTGTFAVPVDIKYIQGQANISVRHRQNISNLMRVCCSEIKRDKCQPDDAGGVHCESDVLGFVKVFRYFSGFYRIKCTDSDEDHAVNLELRLIIR